MAVDMIPQSVIFWTVAETTFEQYIYGWIAITGVLCARMVTHYYRRSGYIG